nr:putative retrotransposon protein [Tanacetum cinerariifolium]
MFLPVADIRAFRILIAIAVLYDYEIWKMDVKVAILNGYLDEDIYMVQPEGLVDPNHPRKVCKLQRSIFGLKQASRSWNKRFDKEIKRFEFTQNLDEPCVYQKASESNVTFLILYVDDLIIMGNHIPSLQSIKTYLGKCFDMKDLGEAVFILGASTSEEVKGMKNVPYASVVGFIMYASSSCIAPAVPQHIILEKLQTMSPENKAHYESEKEAIHLILTRIGDEIYLTVDACKIAQKIGEAIERLQQGDSLNIQDKAKKVKDSTYHKEKMLLCKQAEQGVPPQAKQPDWLADTDEEIDEQELEAHYSYMEKIQEVPTADSNTNSEPLEQTNQNAEDERAMLANLIANLKVVVDENKNIQKQLKKANTSLAHELEQYKYILAEASKTLEESNRMWDSFLVILQTKQTEFENELKKLIEKCKEKSVETKFDKPSVVRQPNAQRLPKPLVLRKPAHFSDSLKRKSFSQTKLVPKTNVSESLSKAVTTQILHQTTRQAVSNTKVIKPGMYQINNRTTKTRAPQLPQTSRNTNPRVSTSTGVTHKTNVSRPQLRSNQMTHKVVPNNSHVKAKKTEVEDHPRNSSISNKTKSVTAYLEVAFRKSTCFVRDLQGNDLLIGNHGSDLYIISLQETNTSTPIYLMAKALPTQAWLWLQRLSHLNFDYINLLSNKDVVIGLPKLKYVKDLCSSCEVSKAKRSSFKTKTVPCSKGRLNLLHIDLCGPMRVASINGKKYIMVIVDDYSIYTWTLFLSLKDETPKVLKEFLTMIQRNLQAPVIYVRTDRGTEFLNKTLHAFFKEEGIEHQTSTPRTPEQNGVVER